MATVSENKDSYWEHLQVSGGWSFQQITVDEHNTLFHGHSKVIVLCSGKKTQKIRNIKLLQIHKGDSECERSFTLLPRYAIRPFSEREWSDMLMRRMGWFLSISTLLYPVPS